MKRLVVCLTVGAAFALVSVSSVEGQSAGWEPAPRATAANAEMPFPALMNGLFGRQRRIEAPPPRFARPARPAPRPRVERSALQPRAAALAPSARFGRTADVQRRTAHRDNAPEYERQVVRYSGSEGPGTIVVNTSQRFLYLVQDDGTALRYGVGVGREGFSWSGTEIVSRKAEWPSWRPPESMKRRQPGLPDYMPGGPDNPLGARALYLGSTLYRIHGSNEPWTIGQAMSSGCIRMRNEDVIDLYERVSVGTRVVVR